MEKWKVSDGEGAFIFTENLRAVCTGFYDPDDKVLFQNWETNRHLIAAAPELLDALESMVEMAETLGIQDNAAINKAYAALAKAKGGQNG